MKKLIVGATTLVAIVVGLIVFATLDSSAQENDEPDTATTTTTIVDEERPGGERFGFGFGGDLSAGLDEFLTCLAEQGFEVPEDPDRGFLFELRSEDFEGLSEALETCGFPERPFRGGFLERFPFGEDLPEGFPFGDGFPFEDLPEDFLDELPEGFPFGDGFPFEGLPEDFFDELPEGFPFGGRFEFHGPLGLDRDALAECLAELGAFGSVEAVRGKLDECLADQPGPAVRGGAHHFGFDFDGFFDFELEEPASESSSV